MASIEEITPTMMLRLEPNEKRPITVRQDCMRGSSVIRRMLAESETLIMHDANTVLIPLPDISYDVLRSLVRYCEHHYDPEVVKPKTPPLAKDVWDAEFVMSPAKKPEDALSDLFRVMHGASYLQIITLLKLCAQTIANMMKGKTPEEIREIFNIKNDFTPEEEAALQKEHKWIDSDEMK